LTEYSSIRDVVIRSADGSIKTVDLFKAKREGDLSQDPFLRPGDRLVVNRLKRAVTMKGEVERPGMYQLLEGEELVELLQAYGKGLTPHADSSRMELVRITGSEEIAGSKIFMSEADIQANTALFDCDVLSIPKRTDLRPVVFIEGAIGIEPGTSIESSTRKAIQFTPGENYGPLVRSIAGLITPTSDTANAYIIRDGALLALDLNPLLYNADYHSEELVHPDDRLVIPFKQYFVSVSGAVLSPGRYPYIPDRPIEYYIGLAGGFDPHKNKNGTVRVQNMFGEPMKTGEHIAPEFNIHAETNTFIYYFKEYAPVITTILSLTTTALTVYATLF
jgi:protein involved in polysaccharide export with SLBB domain